MRRRQRSGPFGRPSVVEALSYRDFRLIWSGLLAANTATWMQNFALGWFVVDLAVRDGQPQLAPLYLGLVGASRAIPALAAGLIAGTVADMLDRRRLLILSQSLASVLAITLAALALTDRLGLVSVMLLSAATAAGLTFDSAARQSMVPRLVPSATLPSAVGLIIGAISAGMILGPLLGGLLFGLMGVGGLLALSASGYFVMIVMVLALRPIERSRGASTTLWRGMRDGYAYIVGDSVIRPLFALLIVMAIFARGVPQLIPAFATQALDAGPTGLSWLLGAMGLGALIGSILSASVGRLRQLGSIHIATATASGLLLFVLSLQMHFAVAIVLAVFFSIVAQTFVATHVMIYQSLTPDRLQGRVVGASAMLVQSMSSFGVLVVGAVGAVIGIDMAMAASGIVLVVVSAFAYGSRLKRFHRERPTSTAMTPVEPGAAE